MTTNDGNIKFPENFRLLHKGEEFVRDKSIEAIESSQDLLMHSNAIEIAMDLIDYFARFYNAAGEDQLTIQCLGIRLFNGCATSLKLLLSGYYQASALLQRDLLETVFLLDYFTTDKGLISLWKSKDKKYRAIFKPVAVREALDKRDKFTGKMRADIYDLYCELAAHPTYEGFKMLTPIPGGDAHCGPFFEYTAMKAVFEELTKVMMQAGTVIPRFFPAKAKKDFEAKIRYMETLGMWTEKFYGRPFDRKPIDDLKSELSKLNK